MKLNDKQLAALDALINEQAPSGEALRASLIEGWRSMALAHYETDSQPTPVAIPYNYALPTLAEINMRVMRDLVKWEKDTPADTRYFKNAMIARSGAWTLRTWQVVVDDVNYWRWKVTGYACQHHVSTENVSSETEDQARSESVNFLLALGVQL